MLKFWRNTVQFFADCIDALYDDEHVTVERFELRQQRWLDYLSNSQRR